MKRSTLDKIISSVGLVVAVGLLLLAGSLWWASNFIHSQVSDQLSAQRITFPAADSASLKALQGEDKTEVSKYAGQELTTGAQAKAFADHYIAAHIENIGDGKTYSELSDEARSNPTDTAAAAKVETVFRGETLRGMLLNAYAFDTMATVARMVAVGAVALAVLLAVLSALGFQHAGSVKRK